MLSKIHFCTDLGGYFIFLVLAVKVKSLPQEKKKNKKKKHSSVRSRVLNTIRPRIPLIKMSHRCACRCSQLDRFTQQPILFKDKSLSDSKQHLKALRSIFQLFKQNGYSTDNGENVWRFKNIQRLKREMGLILPKSY